MINNFIKESPILGLTGMGGGIALNPGPSGFKVNQSLRLVQDQSQSLRRVRGSAIPGGSFTYSFWVKLGSDARNSLFSFGNTYGTGSTGAVLDYNPGGQIWTYVVSASSGAQISGLYRDRSAWYHMMYVSETGVGTKVFVNNELRHSVTDVIPTATNGNYTIGGTAAATPGLTGEFYIAEANFVSGQALTPSSFGETNTDGVWVPKEYEGTYGSDGFHLTFDSGQSEGTGTDSSGNGNHFTENNFRSSDEDILDTPRTNFPTFNPLVRNGGTYDDANMQYVTPTSDSVTPTTFSFNTSNSPSWYVEFTHNLANRSALGVANAQATNYSSSDARGITTPCVVYDSNGPIVIDGSSQSPSQTAWSSGSTISMRFDASTRNIIFANNGTDQTGVTATLAADTDMTIICGDLTGAAGGSTFNLNCGQQPFNQSVPAGFVAPKATNLGVASSISDGSQHCGVVTYTGPISHTTTTTGQTSNITGLNFTPDLVWVKNRTNANWNVIVDVIRVQSDGDNFIASNDTAIEQTNLNGSVSALNSGGFTVITGSDSSNKANLTCSDNFDYVAWCWRAGGAAVSNSDGSRASNVSVNNTAGFSIVSYTGNQTNGATVGHGLGAVPEFIILKDRDTAVNWIVYHKDMSNNPEQFFMHLNTDDERQDLGDVFNDTAPGSSVFTLGNSTQSNGNTKDYIAYCWRSIPGYSKFGRFTGDDQTDGPFIYTGFRPRIILMKSATNSFDWFIWDTERDKFNSADNTLEPNTANTEADASNPVQSIDIFSNGFKILGGNQVNQPGATIVYAAWGDNPVGGAGMAPVTAR